MPYNGGPGKAFAVNGNPRVDGPPSRRPPPTSSTAGTVTTETAGCADGRTVELISVAGAGHQWPGGQPSPLADLAGIPEPSTAVNATDTIWQFFVQHPR